MRLFSLFLVIGLLTGCRAWSPAPAGDGGAADVPSDSTVLEELPLERGYFVLGGECASANNFSVTLHTGYGINASKAHCSYTRIEKTAEDTYQVTQECVLIQGGSFSQEREFSIHESTAYVSTDPSDGSEWAARHCVQSEMSEPFRTNDLSRYLK